MSEEEPWETAHSGLTLRTPGFRPNIVSSLPSSRRRDAPSWQDEELAENSEAEELWEGRGPTLTVEELAEINPREWPSRW